ncbi:LytR/AlgR family response regulator transcription factor [Dyadobacter pollutisoli]|uniref:LytTR family DNA-binding domain-containing protein n=1 Tax=Dyadobacter pollutisoli TaxID=2910158 RepID=A0A9E8NFM1_9BACT|nr:LytTR family DNA-binding domain-containing protein [Dyadobacter pollutisoli]WAC14061.1 LytTR family DNA-binding domain-containing protein [Dyadobacter pollutisoli]
MNASINPFSRVVTLASTASNPIAVHVRGKIIWIAASEITHLRGEGNYTHIYTHKGTTYLVSKTLKSVIETLRADFMRIHKSCAVNPEFVTARVEPDTLLLTNGARLPIARRRMREIQTLLSREYLAVG